MNAGPVSHPAAEAGAQAIQGGFCHYRDRFQAITERAAARFAHRDWHGMHDDTVERLHLYKAVVDEVTPVVADLLGDALSDKLAWTLMKTAYSPWAGECGDFELAETFFNSITRRVFATVGVDRRIEFVASDFDAPQSEVTRIVEHIALPVAGEALTPLGAAALLRSILLGYDLGAPYAQLDEALALAARQLVEHVHLRWGAAAPQPLWQIEMLRPVFYRGQGAYLVGRVARADGLGSFPLAFSLRHPEEGIALDALLLTDDQVSILFSFTRSYFHVAVARPYELVHFLKQIMPWKRVAELYISIGFNKHGKTELYRDLLRHLENSQDPFVVAPGERGMVMAVFTMQSYDMVFKLIKDHFGEPKKTSRQEVMEHYDLVFMHDRAGRLVDAQEFEHLSFARSRFDDDLLAELLSVAPSTVEVVGENVVIKHLYLERRLTPLNLYVQEKPLPQASLAVLDYGQAIKDLAATNIFPGDVLLKNFGVTRHGRVVFYDYDELCLVTDCKFRKIPQARSYSDDFESEPWFYVSKNDIFPEEFRTFLGLTGELRDVFELAHADLFGAEFWRGLQKRHKAGEIMDILPYAANERLQSG